MWQSCSLFIFLSSCKMLSNHSGQPKASVFGDLGWHSGINYLSPGSYTLLLSGIFSVLKVLTINHQHTVHNALVTSDSTNLNTGHNKISSTDPWAKSDLLPKFFFFFLKLCRETIFFFDNQTEFKKDQLILLSFFFKSPELKVLVLIAQQLNIVSK